jgi:hypothetical protein
MPTRSDNPSPEALAKREQRHRALMRSLGMPGYEKRKPGKSRKPEEDITYTSLRKREQRDRKKGLPVPKRPTGRGAKQQEHINKIVPAGPPRDVLREWQQMGLRIKLFQTASNGRWFIQAHNRTAPLDEFIETAKREAAKAQEARDRGEEF